MLEFEAHRQGNMPGVQQHAAGRCSPYTFPITRVPRPLFLDGLHYRQSSVFAPDTRHPWTSHLKHAAESTATPQSQSQPKANMTFVTSAAFPDDISRFVEIEFAAFQDELVNHHLSYRDSTNPEHTLRTIDFYKKCMQHMRTNDLPAQKTVRNRSRTDSKLDFTVRTSDSDTTMAAAQGYRFRKVVDPKTHEIIAFAKSEITALTPEDHASPLDVGHESEPQMNRDWFALNEGLHRSYCGLRPHLYFGMLATHPSHQQRGAATALMSELVAEADALGLEIYCEATRTGKPLYEKYGFVAVKTLRFDPAEYGVLGLGVEVQTVMVRGALGKDGVRKEVRG